ncbi:MAG: deoxyhypusine synthase [Candidatus Omnitrophica bacterium CG11_big_fil_rev_8_21_14_0_20_45_26]|uniref:Deoxyhypusine synthase n=1 Tax=Candidatus Abzuiibacterium crystallinum TaxID=1974748 RepID=A0A2H0LSW2_9BACT|nr:MAG: deoxyhypusine synthase [Candidatus Omnitrophica bacterium CG11_big_fil_rev_8_21_14_0_20_45_26]PIW63987.1 MAG: deoxyhypusine synthase [Candidatus Omnitrophica bacterium CG12_big_fil_rev_8_21_14_0_65_45_16]
MKSAQSKPLTKPEKIQGFIKRHYKHFNSAVLSRAAQAYADHLNQGGKMFLAMAGAMSTAELGISIAQMIREDKIHGICCTGANLEEDIFNLVAHNHYELMPNYRTLKPEEEKALLDRAMNRVTDTCIPEDMAIRRVESVLNQFWKTADEKGESYFPHEYIYQVIRSGQLKPFYEIDPADSWVMAACEKNLPIFTPGWEDSSLGNALVADVLKKKISTPHIIKSGLEQMMALVDWYQAETQGSSMGFFQIGGGIAGDFPICVVPLIQQDMKQDCKLWGYFCQISDSTTSYGSYSGAVPNEKITWGKLSVHTPRFVIESDATIVAPLIFAYVLGQ